MRSKPRRCVGARRKPSPPPPSPKAAAAEPQQVEIAARQQHARALLIRPAKPLGSVILLAGGHGNLSLGKDGGIGWGAANQLVRTRAAYAGARLCHLAAGHGPRPQGGRGARARYPWSTADARDIGAYVAYMRAIAGRSP